MNVAIWIVKYANSGHCWHCQLLKMLQWKKQRYTPALYAIEWLSV